MGSRRGSRRRGLREPREREAGERRAAEEGGRIPAAKRRQIGSEPRHRIATQRLRQRVEPARGAAEEIALHRSRSEPLGGGFERGGGLADLARQPLLRGFRLVHRPILRFLEIASQIGADLADHASGGLDRVIHSFARRLARVRAFVVNHDSLPARALRALFCTNKLEGRLFRDAGQRVDRRRAICLERVEMSGSRDAAPTWSGTTS
ncbi:hypothetical protein [Amaricoccus sp. W119]|uniref:hypothetical protein n=1 Tax=Amaricoccus sp. W119 TaxID=3391833 RepID=UPI0039A67C29